MTRRNLNSNDSETTGHKAVIETGRIVDDDIDGREELAYRYWINSLGIEGVCVNNLYEDLQDGIVLCKVIHKINREIIDWKKVVMKPNNIFTKGSNCQVAMDACEKMEVQMVGIGASDIRDGNKKLILAIVWQLCRLQKNWIDTSRCSI